MTGWIIGVVTHAHVIPNLFRNPSFVLLLVILNLFQNPSFVLLLVILNLFQNPSFVLLLVIPNLFQNPPLCPPPCHSGLVSESIQACFRIRISVTGWIIGVVTHAHVIPCYPEFISGSTALSIQQIWSFALRDF